MIPARVLGIGSVLPGRKVSTSELVGQAGIEASVEDIERRTGIQTRYWSKSETSAADLAAQAIRSALEKAELSGQDLRRIIFVNSTGGDTLIPATANAVIELLGIRNTCDCFDINNACMGFLTAFDVAARSVATGLGPVGIVVVETLSRYLSPENPRPYLVLADAAAAVIIGETEGGEGILASTLGNDGTLQSIVSMAHPGLTQQNEQIIFEGTNKEISSAALDTLERCTLSVLEDCGLVMDDIDWLVPHQPNGTMLGKIIERLGVDSERVVPVVHEIGSVGAASIPVGLDALWRTGTPSPGDRILMAGVGAGISYGALVYQIAS